MFSNEPTEPPLDQPLTRVSMVLFSALSSNECSSEPVNSEPSLLVCTKTCRMIMKTPDQNLEFRYWIRKHGHLKEILAISTF